MNGGAAWLVQALAASALLMASVLLVRRPVRRLAGPELAYALWALPALRLILPPLPPIWHAAPPLARLGDTVTVLIVDPTPAATPAQWPWRLIALGIWAGGAVLLLGWQIIRHHRFCRRLLAVATPLGIERGIRIVASAAAPGPLAFGVWRRTVAFPADMAARYDPEERALALAHELAHHARRDLLANWAALAVLALHWFNPLAWLAVRAFRADQELATDARVLSGRSADERHAYASALVKAAGPVASPAPAACLHAATNLKRRLSMLSLPRASRRHLAAGSVTIALLTGAGLALTASSSAAAAAVAKAETVLQAAVPPAPVPPHPAETAPQAPVGPIEGLHRVKKVVVVKNGQTTTYDAADVDAHLAAGDRVAIRPLAPHSSRMILKMNGDPTTRIEVQDVPAVTAATCGIGNGAPASMVVPNGKGAKRMIVICTDRIAAATVDAERLAASVGGAAFGNALASLASARAAIENNRALTDAQRSEALAGIAQAERELAAKPD